MKKVAFVCVHNSCRSQIAEALAKRYGQGVIEVYSAGTEEREQINQDAVRLMKDLYQVDMEADQHPKLITELPEIDYLITMGCNVNCPFLPFNDRKEDWGLEDPSGKSDEEFKEVIAAIDQKVKELVAEIS
ncbi:arsenate reductase ArsC [Facklamia sp. 7083-14-GEN3]|uniref:arsenate reductase ArsC n=1 Tax=Facklamia sp. 7083-14-GEN3 TaxID=2973478 RepID=UPI00215BBD1B|nr:arsenate reductase ArsC [Facklamia sp. 7083-14-GEN3]MCR8968410.1 arsenate reductase ArsC [Facklamia sp. 7083-14-GEN3]